MIQAMVPLPFAYSSGLTGTRLTCLILSIFSLWTNASPTLSDTRQVTHQNQVRDDHPAQVPNFIRCTGRAPNPSWRYWPAGVDPNQYSKLRQLCAPIEPPSLGFVCPIPSGSPIQIPEYASPFLISIWPLVKICKERCWCPQPDDPDQSEDDLGFSGESGSDTESDSESDPESDSDHNYSDYSGEGDYDSDADMMLSDSESVYGGKQRQSQPQKQCPLLNGKRKCFTPFLPIRPKILPPPRCGGRCSSVAQTCNPTSNIEPSRGSEESCKCTAKRVKSISDPSLPSRWLARCLKVSTIISSLGGRDVGVDINGGGGDVDNEYGAADGNKLPSVTACPCNSTYISRACCDTTDGLVWEGVDKYLGRLHMDWATDEEL